MYKKYTKYLCMPPGFINKFLLVMKLTAILLFTALVQVSAAGFAQRVTFSKKNATLKQVVSEIRKQTGYDVLWSKDKINNAYQINADFNNATLEEVMDKCLKNLPLKFTIEEQTIVIFQDEPSFSDKLKNRLSNLAAIKGKIIDESGNPVAGANVKIKGQPGRGVISGADGQFTIAAAEGDVLLVTFIGYKPYEVKIKADQNSISIRLEVSETAMKDVVVTGMMTRKKDSFTGATAAFSGLELKAIGNTNLIQSLKTLDPSFLVMENNLAGANPNVLPTIELRGQTSITTAGLRDEFSNDPNQPLFILDGFETTLTTIVNLDMNRVASVNILKDAASTALYGSRASNGVVVVETIRPKAGQINVTYTTDGNVEIPDLSSYNMMNAREKLEFERLSGRFISHPRFGTPIGQMALDELYSSRLKDVEKGIDSYWLNEPLQTGYSQRHSLMVNGGDGAITFNVGADYRNIKGAMIGSGRKTWGTTLSLTYRNKNLNISNNLYINGYNSSESNYGLFSKWVNVNPYFDKNAASGRYLQVILNPYTSSGSPTAVEYIKNPYYDAELGSFNKTKSFMVTNNLQARYDLTPSLSFGSSLQVSKGDADNSDFVSALDNRFVSTPVLLRGSLKAKSVKNVSYTANASITYGKAFNKHVVNAILRAEFEDKNFVNDGYTAVGFPNASNGNPRFAYGFDENAVPNASTSVSRRNSIVSNLNYSYDKRYNFDASFTYDGTTSFGRSNLYSPFYGLGASWNINNEEFMKDTEWIDLLRVRGNVGYTGNQNFSSYTSITTYNYVPSYNYSGQGVYVTTLGNPDLKKQNTLQTSLGIDANFFKNRLTVVLNAYRKTTDPLVVAVALPPSTALSLYPINAGRLTVDGAEIILRYSPIYRPADRVVWTLGLTGSTNKQIYSGFNNILEGLNETLRMSNSVTRYRDGGDPNDIWTVPSLGIDPATGREIFKKKDGSYSFEYDYKDQVVVGNSRPTMQGVFSSNLSYKGFTLNLAFRYSYGQDIFNTALFNKVENISMAQLLNNNQDRRALYDRWKTPGDLSEFKNISLTDLLAYQGVVTNTQMSSRFVQRENTINLEAATLGYEFRNFSWMKKARLSNLRLNTYANDVFRISTVKRERGIDYPYAKTISFSLSANFQ